MNNILSPSLPRLDKMPVRIVIDGLTGYLYGRLIKANPMQTMVIFAVREVAQTLFYQLLTLVFNANELQSHMYYVGTSAVVNIIFIITLRELEICGQFFACVYSLAVIGHLIRHVTYIEGEENPA